MKKIRIFLEIQGAAEDENGNPICAGLCMTLGEDSDPEPTAAEYAELMEQLSVEAVLKAAMLDGIYAAADCRLISPEEYDRKYGEDGAYGKL